MKYIKEIIKKNCLEEKKKVLHRNSRIICYLQVSRLACIFSAFLEVHNKVFSWLIGRVQWRQKNLFCLTHRLCDSTEKIAS